MTEHHDRAKQVASGFFRVRNFDKFQHYRDRRPPWIKLYRDLFDDPRFFDLSDTDRYHLIGLFVVASQHENLIPYKVKWLQAQLHTSRPINMKTFIDTGWIELVEQDAIKRLSASAAPAEGYPSRAGGETEVQRQNTETETYIPLPPLLAFGEFQRAKMTTEQHSKLKSGLNGNLETYIARFDRWVNEAPGAKSHGVKREDRHAYESILNWFERDVKEGKAQRPVQVNTPIPGTHMCIICEKDHEWTCTDLTKCYEHRYQWPCAKALAARTVKEPR